MNSRAAYGNLTRMSYSEPPPEETRLSPIALAQPYRTQPRVTWTDDLGTQSCVVDGRMVVGSSPESGIVVHDQTVSRLHAELDARHEGVWVRDLGSRNGTFVDGLQVTGALVPNKSKLRFGSTELVVDYNPPRSRRRYSSPRMGHGSTSASRTRHDMQTARFS